MGTLVGWLALAVALGTAGYAWKLSHELATANRRLDRYNRALFEAGDEIRRLREELTDALSQLRVEVMEQTGALAFAPLMTVRDAQRVHPQAQQILAGFHLGGCNSCAVDPDDTLAELCAANGIEVAALVSNLNGLLAGANGTRGTAPQLVKIPNVALDI